MKKNRLIAIVSILLFVANWIYVILNTENLNLLTFLLMIVIFPTIFYALGVAASFQNLKQINPRRRLLFTLVLSGLYTLGVYIIQFVLNVSMDNIISNTSILTEQMNSINISNIEYNNGIASYIIIFLFSMILILGFSSLFNKLKEK